MCARLSVYELVQIYFVLVVKEIVFITFEYLSFKLKFYLSRNGPLSVYYLLDFCKCKNFRHRWLHHITDKTPTEHPLETRPWMMPYEENMSGTNKQYVPYSTTRPKIEAWNPPEK